MGSATSPGEALRVGVLAVGTELVLGDQVDTNSAWLSSRMRELGAEVVAHVASGDDLAELVPALRWLVDRCDVLLVGGGLGPTHDDRTREAVAEVAGVELRSDPDLEEALVQRFASLGRRMPASNLRQARLPAGARPFPMQGTAPGFGIDVARADGGSCWVCCFPGVLWELHAMYDADVHPVLVERSPGAIVTRHFVVTGMGEASVGEALADVERRMEDEGHAAFGGPGLDLSYLAKKGEIHVRMTARAATPDEARARLEPFYAEALEVLGPVVGARDGETLESFLVRTLIDRTETVAFAESATAGGIAARVATVPDAGKCLFGGVVVYDSATKVTIGGIDDEVLREHGPVSEEVSIALAEAVKERFKVTWGVALTGVAGPDTQNGKPVGHTVVAVAGPHRTVVHTGGYPGDREDVQRRMTTSALEVLRREVLGGPEGADAMRHPGDGR